MSGDLAGRATGQHGAAVGQPPEATGQPPEARGQPPEATGQQSTAEQSSGEQAAAEQGAAEQGAGREGAVDGTTQQTPEELSRAGWETPWPESPTSGAGPPERAELEVAFVTAMRRTGSLMQLMGQAAADRI